MSIFKKIKEINFEEVVWTLKYGRSKNQGTIYDLRKSGFKELPPPVFFLSTGRAGTSWFSKLMASDRSIKVLHNPTPTLAVQSKLAFEILSGNEAETTTKNLLREIYLAGRENDLRYSFKSQKRLAETNNGISFFAPVLAELFPTAKFVHLVRPPVEFIQSGLKRNYYTGSSEDARRIKAESVFEQWEQTSRITKIAWLWSATNKFIHHFHKGHPQRVLLFPFTNLSVERIQEMLNFIEVIVSEQKVRKMIDKPVNVQKGGTGKNYEKWTDTEKDEVRKLCSKLSEELGIPYAK